MRRFALVLAWALVAAGCLGVEQAGPSQTPGPDASQVLERRLTPANVSASEVSIAANPTDPSHLVAAANSGGGFGVYVSRDAGASWTAYRFSPEDVRTEPTDRSRFQALSDPVVAFSPDGSEVYLAGLAYLPTSAVFVAVSPDGGASWPEAHIVDESDPAGRFNDKEWLGVNPETGTLLVAWQKEPALDQLRSVEHRSGVDADVGRIVLSRSTDGGATWSQPTVISRGLHSNGTAIAFTQGGRAHVIWVNYETNTLDHVYSTDDGRSWTDPQPIADVDTVPPYPRYERMHTLPALTADPDGRAIYAVWHDERNGDADVYAVASSDAGKSWGHAVRVNDDPVGNGAAQLYPWADVGPNATLHVSWYDARADPEVPLLRFYHTRAPDPSLAFGPNRPASTEAFQAFCEQVPSGPTDEGACDEHRSLGDYTGIVATQRGVFPAWADGRGNASAIYSARLGTG